jgi:23S rRNA pseudouridine2605 synthase
MRKPSAGSTGDRRKKRQENPGKRTPGKKTSREARPEKRTRDHNPIQKDSWPSKDSDNRRNNPSSRGRSEKPVTPYGKDRKKARDESSPRENRFSEERPRKRGKYGSAPQRDKVPSKYERKSSLRKGALDESIRLNKFIANAGMCSRREADMLIRNGAITVNGEIVTEMGIKVKPGDVVMYGNERLNNVRKVYILLNKPKDYITTSDDPQERKTVIDLVRGACPERVYPVGRLDRNTTGLLLLTNDGEIAKKLTHPKHGIRKLYHVHLDKTLTRADLDSIAKGVKIEDNLVQPDAVSYIDKAENKKEVGIEIHSGQNRIVRRIFEHFGYKVTKLDRVIFAGLTKRDLPRGKWRFLTEKEVSFLKMLR